MSPQICLAGTRAPEAWGRLLPHHSVVFPCLQSWAFSFELSAAWGLELRWCGHLLVSTGARFCGVWPGVGVSSHGRTQGQVCGSAAAGPVDTWWWLSFCHSGRCAVCPVVV